MGATLNLVPAKAGEGALDVASLHIPAGTAQLLQAEARRARKPLDKFILELVRDALEERAAQKALAKAIKDNKGKPSIKAEDLYAQCGL